MKQLQWLGDVIGEWEWWQAVILLFGLVLLFRLPALVKNFGNVFNERQKNNQKHELNMQKLRNQVNSTNRKDKGADND